MKSEWLMYALLAGLSWGTYVPIIFFGGTELGGKPASRIAAILCVGVAYFVIGVVLPIVLFATGQQNLDDVKRSTNGLIFSGLAGVAGAVGAICVVFATKDRANDGAANTDQSSPPADAVMISTTDIASQTQLWLEHTPNAILHGSADEQACARTFASGRPNPNVRLVQPAKIDGKRATIIGLQGGSSREIQVFAVTGCNDPGGVASSFFDTTVTLRNR